ncbi:putative pyrimidine 5'-nucleotidase [Hamiltosporidium magnivora]|uniref:Putative pyrimidine 5'-nucleotidase n=1 Tax=Hamiltosporidium magnivora TaxID=148818 RepID=A0A4Q9LPC3_9MICR|nr:putative pyrimidine 5'-nucleotidase [Hamiltosporidium magnivora]
MTIPTRKKLKDITNISTKNKKSNEIEKCIPVTDEEIEYLDVISDTSSYNLYDDFTVNILSFPIFLYFWQIFLAADKNGVKILSYDEIRNEMYNNPLVYCVSIMCLNTFRKQNLLSKIIEEDLELPYPTIYDEKMSDTVFNKYNIKYLLRYEKDILKLFKFLKPKEATVWFVMFRSRLLNIIFCFFKDYLKDYSDKFNNHPFFRNMLKRQVSKNLDLNLANFDKFLEEKREIEIKMLQFDLNAYFERENVNYYLDKSLIGSENDINKVADLEVDTENFDLTENPTNSGNKSVKDIHLLAGKKTENSKPKAQYPSPISDSKAISDSKEINKVEYKSDVRIAKSIVASDNLPKIQSEKYKGTYKKDTKDRLKLYLQIFFENLLSNPHNPSRETEFSCYKQSNLYKRHKEMCENGTLESSDFIFSFFYKILFLKFETQWKDLLSLISTESNAGIQNILAYLDDYIPSSDFQMGVSNETLFISIQESTIPKMYLDEIVLVFDIDDTLFPTTSYGDKYPDLGTPEFYESQNNIFADPKEENPKKGINDQEIKTKLLVTQHLEYKTELKIFLEKLPFKKICFTNAEKIHAEWALKTLDILDCFICIVHREKLHEYIFLKPNPHAYFAIEQLLETKASNIYFYDDIDQNVQAAKNRGWNSFLVRDSLIDVLETSLSNLP